MTHDELLAEIDSLNDSCSVVDRLAKAIRAVVEMHRPITHTFPTGVQEIYCSCNDELIDEPYPCFTIQTIEKELA